MACYITPSAPAGLTIIDHDYVAGRDFERESGVKVDIGNAYVNMPWDKETSPAQKADDFRILTSDKSSVYHLLEVTGVPTGYRAVLTEPAGSSGTMASGTTGTNITWVLQANTYTITTVVSPSGGGTASATPSVVEHGQSAVLTAIASSGYRFVKWTRNGATISTSSTYTVTNVTMNMEFTAVFEPTTTYYTVTLSREPTAGGTVSGAGTFEDGTAVTVHAVANSGYRFVRWRENGSSVSTSADYSFTIHSNRTLTAVFEQTQEYTITATVSPSGSGSVTGAGTYEEGSSCTLTATPTGQFVFKHWMEDGGVISTSNPYSFPVNRNRNLTAVFATYVDVMTGAAPSEGGHTSGDGRYLTGDRVTISAHPNEGWAFEYWTENGDRFSTDPTYTFIIDRNRYPTAVFTSQKRTVRVTAEPDGAGTVTGDGEYLLGSMVTVTAEANEGYSFLEWRKNGTAVSPNPTYTFKISENTVLTAVFAVRLYSISAMPEPSDGGTVSISSPQVEVHGICKLKATPAEGYSFVKWMERGETIGTSSSLVLEDIVDDHMLIALFSNEVVFYHYKIIFDDNGGSGGPGVYETDDERPQMELEVPSVIPTKEGSIFTGWLIQGTEIILQPGDSAVVEGNVVYTLVAQWLEGPIPVGEDMIYQKIGGHWVVILKQISGETLNFLQPLVRVGNDVGTNGTLQDVGWTDIIIDRRR